MLFHVSLCFSAKNPVIFMQNIVCIILKDKTISQMFKKLVSFFSLFIFFAFLVSVHIFIFLDKSNDSS